MKNTVEEAIDKAGGIVALARGLGIRHNAIYSWKRIPAERVLAVERITGLPKQRLRPDIYGKAPASETAG